MTPEAAKAAALLETVKTFYEGDHTEWTFIRTTSEGFLFRAQDGLEHIFSANDLSALTRVRGSERAIV